MFKLIGNLTKAAVGVAVLPVAVAIDVVGLPASSMHPRKGPFDSTESVVKSIGDNVKKALEP